MSDPGGGYWTHLGSTLKQVAGEVTAQIDDVAAAFVDQARDGGTIFRPGGTQQQFGGGSGESGAAPSTSCSKKLTDDDSATQMANGACDSCAVKFGFFNRKKKCTECLLLFCSTCCPRDPVGVGRTCRRCKILLKRPPIRADLMTLRIKDLQRFLGANRVNTKACVEKKDLVELVIRETGDVSSFRAANRDPIERPNTQAPSSYTASTHRHEWLAKLDTETRPDEIEDEDEEESSSDLVRDFVVVSSPDETSSSSVTPDSESHNSGEGCELKTKQDKNNEEESDNKPSSRTSSSEEAGIDGASALPSNQEPSSPFLIPPTSTLPAAASAVPQKEVSSSPRKFANQGLVYLNEIESADELKELSVKQMKDILAMNRVHFKGVVEKHELLNIIERLWKQEKHFMEGKDNMDDSELCKICMDNPVDCVMLECGHMCTCTNCGKQMNECPICRQYVVRVVRTFKS